jgi:heme A synthase
MAIGSALMWIVVPFGLIWLASHLQQGTSPSMGAYVLIILGLPAAMIVIGRGLAGLDRAFARVTGYDPNERRVPMPWMKSMRGERGSGRKRTVLDVVMVVSVVLAGTAFGLWFFLLAHPGLPSG